jgi:DNA-directed RNA polymerase subunit RPC12/RpoP
VKTPLTSFRWLFLTWPHAGKNLVGWLFIGAGAFLAISLGAGPVLSFFKGLGLEGPLAAFPSLLLVLAGAWLGAGTYTALFCRDDGQSVIPCPRCSQKLRLPQTTGRIRVTCPSCRHQFEPNLP